MTMNIIKGKKRGIIIRHQLPADQADIGSASGWKALIAIIAIVNKVDGHETHPRFTDGFLDFCEISFILRIYLSRRFYASSSSHFMSSSMSSSIVSSLTTGAFIISQMIHMMNTTIETMLKPAITEDDCHSYLALQPNIPALKCTNQ